MDILIFIYFVIFPFGKLFGNLIDIVVIVCCLLFFLKNRKVNFNSFLIVCFFSLIFSLSFFNFINILPGSLYFIRLLFYFYFVYVIYKNYGKDKIKRNVIFNSLILVSVFIGIFGLIQYIFIPDTRFLRDFGWDDHYYRLLSTFLDPAFTGIILLLGNILVLLKTIIKKSKLNYLLILFFNVCILLTYSRSTFLSFLTVIIILLAKYRQKFLFFYLVIFLLGIFILPKPSGEGTNLLRTYSVNQKFINYTKSIEIIKSSPIFGIGFNNICITKSSDFSSHSCSGLDNSILFIVATTGVVGLILFVDMILRIVKNTRKDIYGVVLIISMVAVFIHGMFTQTFFYNFILGWISLLIAISRTRDYM